MGCQYIGLNTSSVVLVVHRIFVALALNKNLQY